MWHHNVVLYIFFFIARLEADSHICIDDRVLLVEMTISVVLSTRPNNFSQVASSEPKRRV